MSDNPFETPKSTVSDIQPDARVGELLSVPRKNPIGFGWKWIKEGFAIFKQSPWLWIGIFVIYLILSMVMSMIPLVSLLAYVINPVFMAGLIYGAFELDQGRTLKVGHLFEGFRKNTGSLFAVGGLYLLGIFIAVALAAAVAYATGSFDEFTQVAKASAGGSEPVALDPRAVSLSSFMLPILIAIALIIPLAMMVWFAPALVMLHDVGAVEAMKRSFNGCIKNMLPYLWYAIIAVVLMIVGVIPLGLGLLVVLPVLTIALYTSYKDIFLD